jgi:hypothetical protein
MNPKPRKAPAPTRYVKLKMEWILEFPSEMVVLPDCLMKAHIAEMARVASLAAKPPKKTKLIDGTRFEIGLHRPRKRKGD